MAHGLNQLQEGVSPEDVLQVLLAENLVQIDRFRLLAYRGFCEERGYPHTATFSQPPTGDGISYENGRVERAQTLAEQEGSGMLPALLANP